MHELMRQVLAHRDLAKAGDLFLLTDAEVADDCSDAIVAIERITSSPDYANSDSQQSVVEICVTRLTGAIRETGTIEKHVEALVLLLRSCLKHDLRTHSFSRDRDPPHAKIASDILSCIFQNYSKRRVMELAIPVAVLFLGKGSEEMTRNITSYLSLAVIDHAALLAECLDVITENIILRGNIAMLRLLPQLYPHNKAAIHCALGGLLSALERSSAMSTSGCDLVADRSGTLQVIRMVASIEPKLLSPYVGRLCSYLSSNTTAPLVVEIVREVAVADPSACVEYKEQLMEAAKQQPSTAPVVARIMGAIGQLNEEEAEECMDYLGNQLCTADTATLPLLLNEILNIGSKFTAPLAPHAECVSSFGHHGTPSVRRLAHRIGQLLSNDEIQSKSTSFDTIFSKRASSERLLHPTFGGGGWAPGASMLPSMAVVQADGRSALLATAAASCATAAGATAGAAAKSAKRSSRPGSSTSSQSSSASAGNPVQYDMPYKDAMYQFCDKHLPKIRVYVDRLSALVPLPIKCTLEENAKKKYRCVRLYFTCCPKGDKCLYPSQSHFVVQSKQSSLWIHLMFLNLQAKASRALNQGDPAVAVLRTCWEHLQPDRSNSFLRLVTSSFPGYKEQNTLCRELWEARYFDVFSLDPVSKLWSCFMCSSPEKVSGILKEDGLPILEGQLKEKKGKWKLFKRWKKRYFTLSGDHITYQKTGDKLETLPVGQIQSVRAVRKKPRDIPKAFEIFTDSGSSYWFKAKDSHDVEQWVHALQIALSRSKRPGYATIG